MYGISRILSLGMSKLNAILYCINEFKIIVLPIVDTKLSLKNSLGGKKKKKKKRIWRVSTKTGLFYGCLLKANDPQMIISQQNWEV